MEKKGVGWRIWVARLLVAVVVFLNLQAAFYFMFQPGGYAPGFELSGEVGSAVIQAIGLLFLMWNIPYLFALVDPLKHFTSLIEAVIMQFIGVSGESLILAGLPGQHPQIAASMGRFILFDGGGLVVLLIALLLTLLEKAKKPGKIPGQIS